MDGKKTTGKLEKQLDLPTSQENPPMLQLRTQTHVTRSELTFVVEAQRHQLCPHQIPQQGHVIRVV